VDATKVALADSAIRRRSSRKSPFGLPSLAADASRVASSYGYDYVKININSLISSNENLLSRTFAAKRDMR
jgi:hypothetical protein